PYFNPEPIEVTVGFGLLRRFKLADVSGSTESKSVGLSTLIALLPFDSLADGPKVDHFSHNVILEVTGYVSAQRSGSTQHRWQMCRHVGGISSFRILMSVSTTSLDVLWGRLVQYFNTRLVDRESSTNA